MPVTVRVGAVHLGWDVVSVAAGGGGIPIRPVQVEGMWTPPAYLLADSSGRLHTAGVERNRPDLGMAIADVRDILGHPQIVVAGATWPAELVFRARMYNPLAEIGKHLRGKPDLVALPFPDNWPEEKVEVYASMVEQLDVMVEPLPESVALSGYVRALGLVHPPDRSMPHGIGATGVYSDGRSMLVVAVHGDDEQPTESVDVPVDAEAMRDARSADDVVIEVMAAARSIGADTSTVLLSGNVRFNDALRLAFQNHLGHRLHVADHPMHALVLGAAHLLVSDTEAEEPEPAGRHAEPVPQRPVDARPQAEYPAPPQPADAGQRSTGPVPGVQYGPGYPTQHDEAPRGLPPNLAELGSRFTRPPSAPDEQQTGRPQGDLAGPPSGPLPGGPVPPLGPQPPYSGAPEPLHGGQRQDAWQDPESDADDRHRKGKLWNKMKGNLFGANTVAGAVALAVVALPSGGDRVELTARQVVGDTGSVVAEEMAADGAAEPVACPSVPYAITKPRPGVTTARGNGPEGHESVAECGRPDVDTLRYLVPGPPGAMDFGPPIEI
ncbi:MULTISPECIES: hypothetical protein [Nocardia]|uniref:hypothetical protein n=1 Tax=Nocardia TaxID=1817 RepID=UPI00135837E8|nr:MULTISPECIES: hypothetical protein [Nocardia]